MSIRVIRFFMLGVLFMGITGLAACSGDDDKSNNKDEWLVACEANWECARGQMCHEGKCIPDTTPWCDSKRNCNTGEICQGGVCQAEGAECTSDDACAIGRVCTAGVCEAGCRSNADCGGGTVCREQAASAQGDDASQPAKLTCGACNSDLQCPSDFTCHEGACIKPELGQCQGYAAGRPCELGAKTADGYECADLGNGPACHATCIGGTKTGPYSCQAGSYCNGANRQPGLCALSECKSPVDSAGCAARVAANPELFPNGAVCAFKGNQAFVCQADRGTVRENGLCNQFQRCAAGLACGPSGTCQKYCQNDDVCSDGKTCIGEDTGGLTQIAGWGLCGDGCRSFGPAGQCGPKGACKALTPRDGVCVYSEGTTPAYATCSSPDECVAGTECMALVQGEPRCYPSCDPTRDVQAAADATCPGGDLASFAQFLNLAPGIGAVDIYVNGARVVTNRTPDSAHTLAVQRAYLNLDVGNAVIDVAAAPSTDNSAPLASLNTTLSANVQTSFALVETADGPVLRKIDIPRGAVAPAATEVSARLALGVDLGHAVDVYVGEVDEPFYPAPVLQAVAYGDTSVFAAPIPGGTYQIHLFEAGVDPTEEAALSVVTVDAPAGSLITVHVWGKFDGGQTLLQTGATSVLYHQAGFTSAGGSCVRLNFSDGRPAFQAGVCFQKCDERDIGANACISSRDTCTVFPRDFTCMPSQKIALGGVCDPDDINPCDAGGFCRPYGDGTGVCASYCDPRGSDDPLLQCPSGQACNPIEGTSLGECGFACEPNANYSSSQCADPLLRACVKLADNQQAFCSASGAIGVDRPCRAVDINNCAPEAVCRRPASAADLNSVILDPVSSTNTSNDGGFCRARCQLFAEESGCPAGQACMIDATHLSTRVGFCQPEDSSLNDLKSLDPCPAESMGKMCGDGSVCIRDGGGAICLQFCELDTNRGCSAEEKCRRLFGSGVGIGYCIPD